MNVWFQTRAGTFRLSLTNVSIWPAGSGLATVLSWKSRATSSLIGSRRLAISAANACISGSSPGRPPKLPASTTPITRSGWSMATRCATHEPMECPTSTVRTIPSSSSRSITSPARSSMR